MCGIIATVGYTKTDVDNMLETIAHRGKDNRGIKEFSWGDRKVILGHNRLAINDTSAAGNQPMEWEGIHLVVNGEIWNYPELRKEYEERGYEFKSNSDSKSNHFSIINGSIPGVLSLTFSFMVVHLPVSKYFF